MPRIQYTAENPVGPCFAMLNLAPQWNWASAFVNFMCRVRAPGLYGTLVQLKLPDSDWADPVLGGVSPSQQIMLIGAGAKAQPLLVALKSLMDRPTLQSP